MGRLFYLIFSAKNEGRNNEVDLPHTNAQTNSIRRNTFSKYDSSIICNNPLSFFVAYEPIKNRKPMLLDSINKSFKLKENSSLLISTEEVDEVLNNKALKSEKSKINRQQNK